MARIKPLTNEKELTTLHSRSCLIMITKEEETLQGMDEEEAGVEELPIIAMNAISWGIDHLSVQIMKKPDTEEHI